MHFIEEEMEKGEEGGGWNMTCLFSSSFNAILIFHVSHLNKIYTFVSKTF